MNTKSQYFIHIGPPKTATTSLQEYFINNEFENITYEGILQPRDKNDKTVCKNVYRKVTSTGDLDFGNINELLKKKNDSGIKFLSEEMFLVESPTMSWKEKIQRLFISTTSIQPTIVIVLRDPVSAIRSYYQELYYRIDRSKIESINDFAKSSYCEVFHYNNLLKFLSETGFDRIKVLEFKKLVNDHYNIADLFDNQNNEKIILPKKNASNKSSKKYHANNATLKKVLISKLPKNKVGANITRLITFFIPDINLKRGRSLNVEIDPQIKNVFSESFERALGH